MRSRHRGGPGPKVPGGRHADCAHDVVMTDSRKAQQKLGKLVYQGRHAVHSAYLHQLPETVRPLGPDELLAGKHTKGHSPRFATEICRGQKAYQGELATVRYRGLQGAGAAAYA